MIFIGKSDQKLQVRDIFTFGGRSHMVRSNSLQVPRWIWGVTGALMIWGLFSANPLLTPFAIGLLPMFWKLLWRRNEPPVLAFAAAMQWLQAASGVFYADAYGMTLSEIFGGPQLEWATRLSLIAVAVNALGMRLALVRLSPLTSSQLTSKASHVNIANSFVAYLFCFAIATVAGFFAFAVPSLAQPIYALVTLKWLAIFILFYSVIQQQSGYVFLFFAVVLELSVGVMGYFADFKGVFFVLLVAALTSTRLRRKHLVATIMIAASLFVLGIVWSAIKQDYREFLNQGSGEQEVVVSLEERGAKLSELVGNVSWETFTNGLDALVLRVSQVNLFALTLLNVPDRVPYADGALWGDALKRIVTPRLFFPGKAVVDDSERANLYTGIQIAGVERGTSIGVGYVAESYVDFGPVFMFMPIFVLGLFYGLIYRLFVFCREKLLGFAIATSILVFGAYTIETSNAKLVGVNVTVLLVMGILYLFFRRSFTQWLQPNVD